MKAFINVDYDLNKNGVMKLALLAYKVGYYRHSM